MIMRRGFMAGCSLSAYCPQYVRQTVDYLKEFYPELSIIQECCGKPLYYLGEQAKFERQFGRLEQSVKNCEIDQLITACEGCLSMVQRSEQFESISLWTVLAQIGLPEAALGKAKDSDMVFTIHDPCPTRDNVVMQQAVIKLLEALGYQVKIAKLSGEKTLCCGMGGMCGVANPKLAHEAMVHRVETLPTKNIVTYCASCRSAMMNGGGQAWHLLDLIWGPVVYQGDKCPENTLNSTFTAWKNRYKTKQLLKNS